MNYNYIHNKELYDTPRAGQRSVGYQTGFPEIIWLAHDKNSKIKFNFSFLPFQKNKISFNFFWNLNDADVTTIKNYKLKLLKKKTLTDKLFLSSLNPPYNISQMGETMVQQLENDRIEENQANNSSYSSIIARIKENKNNNQKNKLKKQIEIEKKKIKK